MSCCAIEACFALTNSPYIGIHDLASSADSLQVLSASVGRQLTSQAAESRLAYFRDHPSAGSFPFNSTRGSSIDVADKGTGIASLKESRTGRCLAYAYLAASAQHPDTARSLVDPSG